jgi:hypothetical protein
MNPETLRRKSPKCEQIVNDELFEGRSGLMKP